MRRKNKMIVYELGWWYLDEESGKSDEQVIAVYSSEQLAQKAIERFKIQPRFIGHEEDFYISKYIINMYVYNLIYEKQNKGIESMNIGYYSSYKKARKVKKKYQAIVPGFKDHSHGFKIKKIEVNRDNYYFM